MSDIQIFQVAGLIYFSVGLGMLFDMESFKKMYKDFAKNPSLMFITGMVAAVVGYLIVVNHNVWEWNRAVLITVIGWAALLKGLTMLAKPKFFTVMVDYIIKANVWGFMNIFVLFFGLVLLYFGFLQ